jgi:hypothetical protein
MTNATMIDLEPFYLDGEKDTHTHVRTLQAFEGDLVSLFAGRNKAVIYIFSDTDQNTNFDSGVNRYTGIELKEDDLELYIDGKINLLDLMNQCEELFILELRLPQEFYEPNKIKRADLPAEYQPSRLSFFNPDLVDASCSRRTENTPAL